VLEKSGQSSIYYVF